MKEIYLIRHGRQNSGRCNVDVPLSKEGRRQADLLGKRLKAEGLDALYSSNLIRAVETAEILSGYLHLPVTRIENLKEIDFGEWEGLENDEIRRRFGEFQKELSQMNEDLAYPGGECSQDVIDRVWPVLQEILHTKKANRIGIVTHGGVIRSLCCYVLGMDVKYRQKIAMDLENTGITCIRYQEENETYFLERLNDAAHLEPEPDLMRRAWKESLLSL